MRCPRNTVSWRKIKASIEQHNSVVVACSGGVDSVFLLDFVSRCSVKATVAYFDHGLGNGSSAFVVDLATKYGMPFVIGCGEGIDQAASIEAEARSQRYAFLQKVLLYTSSSKVLTAHHLNDQVETVLLRLLRGYDHSTLGMRPDNGLVFRPLLDVPKAEIVKGAETRGLTWLEDESNMNMDFERNWLRQDIIPQLMLRRNVERTVVKGLGH